MNKSDKDTVKDKTVKDTPIEALPSQDEVAPAEEEESAYVIEELMDEPLTTLAWCGRMQRSVCD